MWKFLRTKNFVNLLIYFLIGIFLLLLLKIYQINQPLENTEKLQGTILIWHSSQGKIVEIIENTLNGFEKLNPNVNVIYRYIPINENPSRFIAQSQTGFGASAMILESKNMGELIKRKLINPIDSADLNLSIYFPSTLSQVRYQDKIYGIPLASNTKVLCYNKAKLEEISDPLLRQPPTNLDGLMERAIKGYSIGMVSSFEDTFWGIGAFGGKIFNDLGIIEPNWEAWAKWIDWLKNASTQPNFILNSDRIILHNAFAKGKLTYYVCNSTEIADLANTLEDNLRITLLPQGEGGKATPILYTKVMVFNPNNSSNENQLGLAFSNFMTNPEQQLQVVVRTQSFIPSNRHVVLNVVLLPLESVLLKQSENAFAIPLNNFEQFTEIFEKGELLYQKAFIGEISSLEAAKQFTLLINNPSKLP